MSALPVPPAPAPAPTPVNPVSASTLVLPAKPGTGEPVADGRPAVADTSLRVDVGLLDKLMTLVGELVLARNQIMQFGASQEDAAFLGTVQRLNLLTTELQTNVMKTRMQPIGNVWSKFPRVVRDLAVACGKRVRFDMDGQETELDKTIIEAIRDPLTHLVRNAVDHGIEPPDARAARGSSKSSSCLACTPRPQAISAIHLASGNAEPTAVPMAATSSCSGWAVALSKSSRISSPCWRTPPPAPRTSTKPRRE